ncbi:hypothetical protein Tco_1021266 [Tanacetum coccineum]
MVNTNTFLENSWSRPSSSAYGLSNIWYQSKLGRPLRKKMHYGFIQRQLKRERERHGWINLSTKCMIKGIDQGHWDDICFAVNKLDDQMKFLFIYGIGEVVVKNGDQGYLIPGVHYAPELNEDKLRVMQNEFLENYFDSLEKGDTTAAGMKTDGMLSMDNDLIEIKGTTYSTKYAYKECRKRQRVYLPSASHQCDFVEIQAPNMEAANRKGKEKIEHFGIILEDARKEADSHQLQPISPNIKKSQTMNKDLQGMIKRPMN